jgi:hypothetical protein
LRHQIGSVDHDEVRCLVGCDRGPKLDSVTLLWYVVMLRSMFGYLASKPFSRVSRNEPIPPSSNTQKFRATFSQAGRDPDMITFSEKV